MEIEIVVALIFSPKDFEKKIFDCVVDYVEKG